MILKRLAAAFFLLFTFYVTGNAQHRKTQNIIVITLDGLRWQEVFKGVDAAILRQTKYVTDPQVVQPFTGDSETENRTALMPFLWNVVATQGQLYGNREYGNKVNCTNHHLISYPGYSEMLVGFRHSKVSSNDKKDNPHATVFEFIGKEEGFRDQVAAFATWDAFPYILRESSSEIYVNAGQDLAEGKLTHREHRLNELAQNGARRTDSITFAYAMEYLKRERPRVTFIGFDGTDHHAHKGQYDQYLSAAHAADRMIAELWEWVQSQPDYRDNTTLFITTDHGRGNGKNNWRKHRLLAPGSRHIWFAVIGPDTPSFGEMKVKTLTYQNQVAKTLAAFLGLPYKNSRPVGDVIQTMIAVPRPANDSSLYSSTKSAN